MKRYISIWIPLLLALTGNAQILTYLNRAADQPDPSISTPVHFTLTFSEMVHGFDASDISFAGSSVDGNLLATITGGPQYFDIYVTGMIPTGTLKLTIRQGAALGTDPFNITTTNAATISVVINAASPKVTINQTVGQNDPTKYPYVSFTVAFSVPVKGFDVSDISLAGSTAGGTLIVNAGGIDPSYSVIVTGMTSSGIVKASILPGAGVSLEGQVSLASTSTDNSVSFDRTAPPTVTINQVPTQPDPTSEGVAKYQATFSVPVTDFDESDVSLTGTTAAGPTEKLVTGGPQIFDISVYGNFTSSGNIVASIPAGAAKSEYTRDPNLASTSTDNVVRYEMPSPNVYVGTPPLQADPINKPTIRFFAEFNQDVTGFSSSDISFAGSTTGGILIATLTQGTTPRSYDIVVSGMASVGDVVVSVPAGVATNREGKPNLASKPFPSPGMDNIVHYSGPEPGIPAVTINKATNQADPTSVSPVRFKAIFSESVTGFDASDLVFTGSTVEGDLAGSITPISNKEYEISLSGMTSPGNVAVSVRAGAAYNVVNQYNVVSTSTDNVVLFTAGSAPPPPTVTINQAVSQADPTSTMPVHFLVTFSQNVNGFDASDISFVGTTTSGALAATVTGGGAIYNVAVTGMTSSGLVVARIPAGMAFNSAFLPNAASTSTDNGITYNFSKPVASISDVTVFEAEGVAVLTISLSHATKEQVKIGYATRDGTARTVKKVKDYKSVDSKATIQSGALSTTVSIPVHNDYLQETSEYFYVNLNTLTNCLPGDVNATVTILDGWPSSSRKIAADLDTKSLSENEDAGNFDLKVYSNPSDLDFTIDIISENNSPAEVTVISTDGRVVEVLKSRNNTLTMGLEWKAGLYIVDVVQGLNRKTIKLIKN